MYCIILSKLYTLLYNINDNPRHTKPKWAIKRHTTDRFHLFDPHRISSLSTTAPDDFDNSPLGHSTAHAVKMQYIHSEERLPIPDNGEHSASSLNPVFASYPWCVLCVCVVDDWGDKEGDGPR